MVIQREVVGALFSGASIHLLAHTGKHIEVEGNAVRARWTDRGQWQTFVIENYGGRAIFQAMRCFSKLIQMHLSMLMVRQSRLLGRIGETGKGFSLRGSMVVVLSCQVTPSSYGRTQAR